MILRRLSLAAALWLGALAVGCGGTGVAETAHVKQTVRAALADLARADGHAFCALATPAAQAKLARTLPGYSCARLVAYVGRHLSPAAKDALLHARVQRVTISNSTARVRAADITATQGSMKGLLNDGGKPTKLAEQPDGSWKISE